MIGNQPADIPLEQTLAFVLPPLPPGARRLLEVGCGSGELAEALAKRGYDVTAIDLDPEAVAETRARGVAAIEADFLAYDAQPFDAVLFTRSLHHIGPLAPAIERTRSLLVPGGLVVAEEFAFEHADRPTVAWFYEERDRLERSGQITVDEHPDAPEIEDPLARWRHFFTVTHDVHEGAAMLSALAVGFESITESRAPYLYRWIAHRVPADASGEGVVRALLDRERRGIESGALRAIGLRMVGRRP